MLELAEEGVLSPKSFINDLKSLAATISRDPSAVASSTTDGGQNLAEMGYMREYIEDLPYTGEVMNLTLERWDEWSAKEHLGVYPSDKPGRKACRLCGAGDHDLQLDEATRSLPLRAVRRLPPGILSIRRVY